MSYARKPDPSVDWADVENPPATYAPSSHNHNDLYYLKSLVDTALGLKSNIGHGHAISDVAELTSSLAAKLESETDPTVPTHVKTIPSNHVNAMGAANSPDASNPFATVNDLTGGSVVKSRAAFDHLAYTFGGQTRTMQPALWEKHTSWLGVLLTTFNNQLSQAGTMVHGWAEFCGYITLMRTAASANADAFNAENNAMWTRGSSATGMNGFVFYTEVCPFDASYANTGASTGSRIWAGLCTAGISAGALAADNPNSDRCGFTFKNVNGGAFTDANWHFETRTAGGSITRTDTGLPIIQDNVYRMWMYCSQGVTGEIFFEIHNITAGTSAAGSHTTNLPSAGVTMAAGVGIRTINAVQRSIRRAQILTTLA